MVCGSKAPHRLQHAAAAAGEVGATARTRKGVDQRDGAKQKDGPKELRLLLVGEVSRHAPNRGSAA